MGRHSDIIDDLYEYRGLSWSIGMDEGAQTIPNFLRNYRDVIIGGSLDRHPVELCYDILCPPFQYHPKKDVFNAAQSGAMIPNLVTHEWDYMQRELHAYLDLSMFTKNRIVFNRSGKCGFHAFPIIHRHPEVDLQNDWKLLTLFIGGNDLCLACSEAVPTLTPADFEKHLKEVLDEVYKIPKVFVNLVLVGNLSGFYQLSLKNEYCKDVHRLLPIECICAFLDGPEGVKLRNELGNTATIFNTIMRKVAAEYAGKRDDFAVVIQPFISDTDLGNLPITFLSNLDCFHPSLMAHQQLAKALWNNMITPAAQKKTFLDLFDPFLCPTNETLLYTR